MILQFYTVHLFFFLSRNEALDVRIFQNHIDGKKFSSLQASTLCSCIFADSLKSELIDRQFGLWTLNNILEISVLKGGGFKVDYSPQFFKLSTRACKNTAFESDFISVYFINIYFLFII